ncbi:hypothetical protein M514_10186 [Trichuris suis]|uniref:Uncharacterized protein n=1 Tax=Trichuris suis TaxID=68888 RepID=A0A085LVE9_9BILA|nr:hypothetical protein M513_10186 [Trichuris suis]KFD68460.1 hypothetical protein M514_10186 [Trichuris suis]
MRSLEHLKWDQSVVIIKADKGNMVFIMNIDAYNTKVAELLQSGMHATMLKDSADNVRKTLQVKLSDLFVETDEERMFDIAKRLKWTTTVKCPELFCLAKVHKENMPL